MIISELSELSLIYLIHLICLATINKFIKTYSASFIVAASFFVFLFVVSAQTPGSGSSISFKKDSNKLFVITFKNLQGIRSFSLKAPGKGPYGGDFGGCPTLRILDNVLFSDPDDFTPSMKAEITDCNGNVDEMEVPPPQDGITKGVRKGGVEAAPSLAVSSQPPGGQAQVVKRPELKKQEVSARGGLARAGTAEGPVLGGKKPEINYPVLELGNCQNETECRAYCNDPSHIKACVDFAESHELISREEAERGRRFAATSQGERPGGCGNETECVTYCEESSHIEECIAFAEKHGFMPEEELKQAKKVLPLIKSGQTPGGCKTKAQCELYCSGAEHIEACLKFAEENDLIPPDELAIAKKMMPLIKSGETPGRCSSKVQCEAYCSTPGHMKQCLEFAEKQGIIPQEELEQAKKFLPLMEKRETPGSCTSKESCEEYCNTEGHMEECIAFAEKAGFMTKEQAEMAKKHGGKGPGNCKSETECKAYCEDPEHKEGCLNFATQAGFIKPEEAEFSRKLGCNSPEECMELCQKPENKETCQSLMKGFMPGGEGGMPPGFEGGMPPGFKGEFPGHEGFQGQGGFPGQGGFGGPGGCKSKEECERYCKEHPKECGGSDTGGPGGCKSVEECTAYCREHPAECGYDGGGGGGGDGGHLPSCVPPPSDLVTWLKGDSLLGKSSGGVKVVSGKVGNAFKFDGTGSINFGNPSDLNFGTGPFSLETWFLWDGGGSSKGNIIRKSNYPVSGNGSGYWLVIGKDNKILEFFTGETVGNPGQPRGRITASVSSGEWHHAVVTRNDSGVMNLYLDGELKGNTQIFGAETTSEAPFTLGAWDDRFGLSEFFSGLIDEVTIYKKALSLAEVETLYKAGSQGKCSSAGAFQRPAPSIIQPPPTGQYPAPSGDVQQQIQEQYQKVYDDFYKQQYQQQSQPQSSSLPLPPPPSTSGGTSLPSYCSSFATVPSCSYVGVPDSQNYKYCKECYPDK